MSASAVLPTDAPIAIVGGAGGTNIGDSLRRAVLVSGRRSLFFDVQDAEGGLPLLRAVAWRFNDRKPLRIRRFCARLVEQCAAHRPRVLISTGRAPIIASTLESLRALGIRCVNYSTDDPWNPTSHARWFLRALPHYDRVFSPRRSNLDDLRRLGCRAVNYLPFGYDEGLCRPLLEKQAASEAPDVLLVGGADPDRVAFVEAMLTQGVSVTLVGDYWERFKVTRPYARGHLDPAQVRALTQSSKLNLVLVRRLNRDGHVMRSFEIAANGGVMLAEDTAEHREIFGPDGECVRYFRSAEEAAVGAKALIADPLERYRLSSAIRVRVLAGRHSYASRLQTMIERTFAPSHSEGPEE